ncbi:universal stress protein [Aetokthonos hydrillicola Thurmond2011]|jgi:nucleotide-binding universal stress UspA family protein|uniref:Universal stress protein n=1 Tax=Aetokthonos hydrillicola Thurmond2011 TaxID=2712845 RepID=A0AAP5I333_9CYAN|nr:universal stress protein [Aetokthonos hydrillicola]MBO3458321.1 universal stress protein [Aetokthonos hydrillicola CCALA 1050]MBW4585884.1 universal stress protein [Aetokthonos hydrillicola CCALA 1050]MDR9893891.1 universal stress protein [Aetokthonos hydrillicola Thurmond2011]
MFQKILVAVDNNTEKTEIDRHVFDEAVSLAKAMNAHLMLLHVFYPFDDEFFNPLVVEPHIVHPTLYTETSNQYIKRLEECKQEGVDLLTSLREQAITAGVTAEFTLKAGDAGRMICEVARNWEADLIVVGRRGYRGFSEFLLGSVSNYVLHHAPCSVLTVQGAIHASAAS